MNASANIAGYRITGLGMPSPCNQSWLSKRTWWCCALVPQKQVLVGSGATRPGLKPHTVTWEERSNVMHANNALSLVYHARFVFQANFTYLRSISQGRDSGLDSTIYPAYTHTSTALRTLAQTSVGLQPPSLLSEPSYHYQFAVWNR